MFDWIPAIAVFFTVILMAFATGFILDSKKVRKREREITPKYSEGTFRIIPYHGGKFAVESYNKWGEWEKHCKYYEYNHSPVRVFDSVSEAEVYIEEQLKKRIEMMKALRKEKEHLARPPIYYNPSDVS